MGGRFFSNISIEIILLGIFAITSIVDTTITVIKYEKSNNEMKLCYDNSKQEAFYAVKGGIGYCFYRTREFPYRISGGIVDVNGE